MLVGWKIARNTGMFAAALSSIVPKMLIMANFESKGWYMRLKSLLLKNYRCFEEFKWELDSAYNLHVVIAENMVGKSALLQGLRVGLSTFLGAFTGASIKPIERKDHRVIGENPLANIARECFVECAVEFQNPSTRVLKWRRYRNDPFREHSKTRNLEGNISEFGTQLFDAVNERQEGTLPLLMYVGTEYIHVAKASTRELSFDGSAFMGYWNCLGEKSMESYIFRWLDEMEGIHTRQPHSSAESTLYGMLPSDFLHLFQATIHDLLPEIVKVEWIRDPARFRSRGSQLESEEIATAFVFQDGSVRLFDMLSDGYRYLILLAGELSMRSLLLNKHLGRQVRAQITGIVMIDEFGIHLHPSLQADALQRLQSAFPRVQFLLTTHSPLLLNGLKKEQVHVMKVEGGNRVVRHPGRDVIGYGAEGILMEVFGLQSTFDKETLEWRERYDALTRKSVLTELTSSEQEEYQALGKELSALFYDPSMYDPTYELVKEKMRELSVNHAGKPIDFKDLLEQATTSVWNQLSQPHNP